ncbi:MAG: general secretion pathway protein D [Pseudohongiellaceae bacterium]|jgi:general secretion pathway protein D
MRSSILISLVSLALLAGPLTAQDVQLIPGAPGTGQGDSYVFQFDEENGEKLIDFIDLAKVILQRPIKYAPTEIGDVTIFIVGPLTVEKAKFYQFFQAVLRAYDFIIMDYGPKGSSFLSIQKIGGGGAGARGGGAFIKSKAPIVPMDRLEEYSEDPATLITTSIPLKYIDARSAMASFQPYFDTTIEGIRNVENSNSLVITGFGTNVWGAYQLVGLVDVPPFKPQPHIRKRELQNTSVDEIETVLTELLAAARGLRPGQTAQPQQAGALASQSIEPRVILDARSNSLLLAGEEEMVERIESWIDILDVEVEPRSFTHVYRLENTDAGSMEEILKDVLADDQSSAGSGRAAQPGSGASSLEIPASVTADEISNSLVITASDRKYADLIETIRSLDIRRKQVLVEAAIVETQESLSEIFKAGVGVATGDVTAGDEKGGGFISNFGTPLGFDDTGAVDIGASLQNLQGSNGGNFATFSSSAVPIPLFLQWISGHTKTKVLSRPSVLTNDNEEAELSAEEETSYETTSVTNNTTQSNFESVTAGIRLNVSPTISAGNYLRLRVRLEISDFRPARSGNSAAPPDINRREIDTPITLPDGHTIILGGLVTHSNSESKSKIPWLGDLPLIGWLFRAEDESQNDLHLYVFITAHIIDGDFALLNEISAAREQDVERLGGDLSELVGSVSVSEDDDRILPLTGLDEVFDMPTPAMPTSGPREER